MQNRPVKTLASDGMFFECPRWHEGRWHVTDILRSAIITLLDDGSDVRDHVLFDGHVAGTGWLPDGSLLAVANEQHALLRVDDSGAISTYATLDAYGRGLANDMVVDSHGRAFVGRIGFEPDELDNGNMPPPGVVLRVDPGGEVALVAEDIVVPNGMVITADGSTLIVGETLASRYTAFDIAADGTLSGRRVWAELEPVEGAQGVAPDGCALDAEGRIWFADSFGRRFVLVAEGGEVAEEIHLPDGLNAYACMLGGDDGRSLLLCCGPGHSAEDRAARKSVLLSTKVEVPHAGLP